MRLVNNLYILQLDINIVYDKVVLGYFSDRRTGVV